jgi:AAA domain/UvrD-like helicase C-terminal domain
MNKSKLNSEQLAIIEAPFGHHMIIKACAGSGKTTTILYRIKQLIDWGALADNITLITFTKASAKDMKDRMTRLFGGPIISNCRTIDSLCYLVAKSRGLVGPKTHVSEYAGLYRAILGQEAANEAKGGIESAKFVFIDEYQDINDEQFEIFKEMARIGHYIIGIGDPAQNIYAFRGSNIRYILDFEMAFEGALAFNLAMNYRSSVEIIDFSNDILKEVYRSLEVADNEGFKYMKSATDRNKSKPEIKRMKNKVKEADIIVNEITDKMARYTNIRYSDFAILARCRQNLYEIETRLKEKKINCVLYDSNDKEPIIINNYDHITLSTIHQAKGREWSYVYLVGASNSNIGSDLAADVTHAEATRLFYVACTRAKNRLYISFIYEPSYLFYYVDKSKYIDIGVGDIPKMRLRTYTLKRPSITHVIDNLLRGPHYRTIKANNILTCEFVATELHGPFTHHKLVIRERIYSIIGIFVELAILRQIELQQGHINVRNPSWVRRLMACYIDHWPVMTNGAFSSKDKANLGKQLLEVAKKYGIVTPRIMPTSHNLIGYTVRDNQITTYATLEANVATFNGLMPSLDILRDIFELSKVSEIVKESKCECVDNCARLGAIQCTCCRKSKKCGAKCKRSAPCIYCAAADDSHILRRRLLFIGPSNDFYGHYGALIEQGLATFVPLIENADIHIHGEVDGITGEIDLYDRETKTLYDIKVSTSRIFKVEWEVQLVFYAIMLADMGLDVEQIGIYNALTGQLWTADVGDLAAKRPLVDILNEAVLNDRMMRASVKD